MINVAGGWAGGNAGDADWIKNADLMWKQSVWSSTISGTLAAKFLSENGLLVLPGAKPATGQFPFGMIFKCYKKFSYLCNLYHNLCIFNGG